MCTGRGRVWTPEPFWNSLPALNSWPCGSNRLFPETRERSHVLVKKIAGHLIWFLACVNMYVMHIIFLKITFINMLSTSKIYCCKFSKYDWTSCFHHQKLTNLPLCYCCPASVCKFRGCHLGNIFSVDLNLPWFLRPLTTFPKNWHVYPWQYFQSFFPSNWSPNSSKVETKLRHKQMVDVNLGSISWSNIGIIWGQEWMILFTNYGKFILLCIPGMLRNWMS